MTAADHIEVVRLTLPVHGRSQARPISRHGRGRAELVNLAAHATINQPPADRSESAIGRYAWLTPQVTLSD
jgi:hypothetical protein